MAKKEENEIVEAPVVAAEAPAEAPVVEAKAVPVNDAPNPTDAMLEFDNWVSNNRYADADERAAKMQELGL